MRMPPEISTLSYDLNKKINFQNKLIYGCKVDLLTSVEFLSSIVKSLNNKELLENFSILDKFELSQYDLDQFRSLLTFHMDIPFKFERVQNGVIIYPYDYSLYFHSNPEFYHKREFNIDILYSDIDINFYTSRLEMKYTRELIYFLENNFRLDLI